MSEPSADLQDQLAQQPADQTGDAQTDQSGDAAVSQEPQTEPKPDVEKMEKRLRDKDAFITQLQRENQDIRDRFFGLQDQVNRLTEATLRRPQTPADPDIGLPFDPDEEPVSRSSKPSMPSIQELQNTQLLKAMAFKTGVDTVGAFISSHPEITEPEKLDKLQRTLAENYGFDLRNVPPQQLPFLNQRLENAYLLAFKDEVLVKPKPTPQVKPKKEGVIPGDSGGLTRERQLAVDGTAYKPRDAMTMAEASRNARAALFGD